MVLAFPIVRGKPIFMPDNDLYFVIPTDRLRDVGETVELYDEHFWRNGHSVKMIVFDDSSPVAQEKYYPLLEQTKTHNDLFYVGPKEKEEFTGHLNRRLNDRKLEGLVKNLFRPSYGGNRNVTLMSTLGGLMVSSDDDMRPYALVEASPESLVDDEVSRGKLFKAYYGFEPDVFQQNLLRIVDDVVSHIKGSLELWPTLVEICYLHKDRKGLPQVRVKNTKKKAE
jgi:hypothetical protein